MDPLGYSISYKRNIRTEASEMNPSKAIASFIERQPISIPVYRIYVTELRGYFDRSHADP